MKFSSKARPSSSPEDVWTTAFNQLSQRMSGFFVRSESYQRALAYIQGLRSFSGTKKRVASV